MVEMWLRAEGMDAARADPGPASGAGQPAAGGGGGSGGRRPGRGVRRTGWNADGPRRLAALVADRAPAAPARSTGGSRRDGRRRQASRVPTGCRSCGGSAPGPSGRARGGAPRMRPGSRSGCRCWTSRTCRSTPRRSAASEAGGPGGARRPSRWSRRCCLRAGRYFRPGLVHVHVWDVGRFTGSLPGLYPLTRTGLLTVHDPGNLRGAARRAGRPDPARAHPRPRRRAPVAAGAGGRHRRAHRAVGRRGAGRRRAGAAGGGPGPAGAARRPGLRDLAWCSSTSR